MPKITPKEFLFHWVDYNLPRFFHSALFVHSFLRESKRVLLKNPWEPLGAAPVDHAHLPFLPSAGMDGFQHIQLKVQLHKLNILWSYCSSFFGF